ncbi:hypothetical protein [Ancylobacter mangrovi]|uniref:hypothetical protein n=1 Tax=Ancylobacter mangrovi TaxID=2972472 RepID=UPI0021632A43|nr:hypothetical protein [Ancylobacter mangrovi]MCS0501569.1 hypothetical protein [Ancylobacter mangrovi]
MADRPIPFSAPMARALLAGAKTQTRRTIKPQPTVRPNGAWSWDGRNGGFVGSSGTHVEEGFPESARYWSRIQPGDRLWVREAYFQRGHWEPVPGGVTRKGGRQKWRFVPDDDVVLFDPPPVYRKGRHQSDPATPAWHQRLGRFMPRRHSRLTLIVTDVRVQRLQEISEEDARAEGVLPLPSGRFHCGYDEEGEVTSRSAITAYGWLWNAINGEDAWAADPWVAAYTFTVHRHHIDLAGAAHG